MDDGRFYAWSLDVNVAQHVALKRDADNDLVAVTWGNHAFGFSPSNELQQAITAMVDQFLDRFISDFLAENEP